jgi:DDB1- and CUL4-associated factor 12
MQMKRNIDAKAFSDTLEPSFQLQGLVANRELGSSHLRQSFRAGDRYNSGRRTSINRVMDLIGFGKSGGKNLSDAIETRVTRSTVAKDLRINSVNSHNQLMHHSLRRLPALLEEFSFDLQGTDKIFSAAWISDTQVLLGTKCQNLILLDINTGKKIKLPGMTAISTDQPYNSHTYGIHAISTNPSKTILAVGAGRPDDPTDDFDIQLFEIPSFHPLGVLRGHTDIIFSFHWIDDSTLVSGARDRSLKIWNIAETLSEEYVSKTFLANLKLFSPQASQIEHEDKIRDLALDRSTETCYSLSSDGYVKIWDCSRMSVTSSVSLIHTNETVCLALDSDRHIVTVGSQSHLSIIDPRVSQIVHIFESLDEGWGVRSMSVNSGLLSIGGGMGKVSFYDLRAHRYLSWEGDQGINGEKLQDCLQVSKGWLCKDEVFQRHFHNLQVSNAIYTLMYDQSFGKLFVAGGPLQLNLKGSMAGLWQ